MRNFATLTNFSLISVLFFCLPGAIVMAQDNSNSLSGFSEAAWDWHAGDLIFRSGIDPFDDLLASETGVTFGSIGILRASSGGPRVVFVDPEVGVTEVTLDVFISGLSNQQYSVYRVEAANHWGHSDSPLSYNALLVAYGLPADQFRLLGGNQYYGAELVYLAALGAGVDLGNPARLSDLVGKNPSLKDMFLVNWEKHPFCQYVIELEECWSLIKDLAIVTNSSILESPFLEKITLD